MRSQSVGYDDSLGGIEYFTLLEDFSEKLVSSGKSISDFLGSQDESFDCDLSSWVGENVTNGYPSIDETIGGVLDDQEIDITVRVWRSVDVGAEKDDLLRTVAPQKFCEELLSKIVNFW